MMWDFSNGGGAPRSGPNSPYQDASSTSSPMPEPAPMPFNPIGAPSCIPNLQAPTPFYSPGPWGHPAPPISLPPLPLHRQRAPAPSGPSRYHGSEFQSQQYTRPPAVLHHSLPPLTADQYHYSNCTGKRKALCIGINYHLQPDELHGCVNDAQNVRKFLIRYHNYKPEDIVMLTDNSSHSRDQPTRRHILDAMRWLVKDARQNDALFFHYSGHGGQVEDKDGDKVGGLDTVIFPVDHKTAGCIVDDMMHEIMVKPLPDQCRLTALFDSSHSGSALCLPYCYHSNGREKGSQIKRSHQKSKSTPADVILWSGCKNNQNGTDTYKNGEATGAMSYAFMTALCQQPRQTYQQLLISIRAILKNKYSQKPQLSSSHRIDINKSFIM